MTLPILFTPTPHDLSTDNADANDAFGQVANTTMANLQKINTFLKAQTFTFARSGMPAKVSGIFTAGATVAFTAGQWPACSITLPASPQALLINFGAVVFAGDMQGINNWLGVTFRLSGGTTHPANEDNLRRVLVNFAGTGSSRTVVIPGSKLTGGAVVTATPWWIAQCEASVNTSACFVQGGCLTMIALAS